MKVIVTIEISDSTTEEKLLKAGLNRNEVAYLYQKAFSDIVQMVMKPGCEATINCVVTDNTKEEIDFDYAAEDDS